MSIESPEELEQLKAAGRIVAAAIRAMRAQVRPGISTAELDRIGGRVFAQAGARSGPQLDYDFPGVNCISVNDEVDHGIPGPRRLRNGDIVKLDVTAELDGYYADACVTTPVGRVAPSAQRLIGASRRALNHGLQVARAGQPLNAIGRAVESSVASDGYSVCRELMGHGIGRRIHEAPNVPNYFVRELTRPLTTGLVMTIEPLIAAGSGQIWEQSDGWTIMTRDRSLSAHSEHTIVITDGAPLILTA